MGGSTAVVDGLGAYELLCLSENIQKSRNSFLCVRPGGEQLDRAAKPGDLVPTSAWGRPARMPRVLSKRMSLRSQTARITVAGGDP